MDKPKDNDPYLMDHNYDGIQELDNPMPSWWLITFFGTIIFAAIYYFHFEITKSSSSDSELAQELLEIEALRKNTQANEPQKQEEDLKALIGDKISIEAGEKVFQAKCASCHGTKGEGLIGPNLTDNFWIHGKGDIENLVSVINIGVADKGMPAWKTLIPTTDINRLGAFLVSIQGTSPANAKKPEGQKIN